MKEYKFREPKPTIGNRKWIQKKLPQVYSHLNMGTKTMSKRKKDE